MQMDEESLYEWKETAGGICIIGCRASLSEITVPEQIAGLPVVQIGDYAFRGMDALEEIHLPDSLRYLGDHVFFNCLKLKRLLVYDTLNHVGDGAFKNCDHLSEITMIVRNDRAAALRLLISDIMQDVWVYLIYEDRVPKVEAQLVFPAFFFDYIENYPARIFEEVIYGSGQAYRQSFRGGDVDYEAYDRLFERSVREDSIQAVIGHAVGRLSCPVRLGTERRQAYESWLGEHGKDLMKFCLTEDRPEALEQILKLDLFDEEQTGMMLELALQKKKVEFITLLMEYQGRRFAEGRKKKRFLL